MKPRPVLPLPEAIPNRRDGWKQETAQPIPGSPFCNASERVLATPHYDDELSAAIRAHEMGHAKYSPAILNPAELGASHQTIAAVEEARVNTLVDRVVPLDGLRSDDVDYPAMKQAIDNEDALTAVRIAVASIGSGRRFAIAKALNDSEPSPLIRAVRAAIGSTTETLGNRRPAFRLTVAIARAIDAAFGIEPPKPETEEGESEGEESSEPADGELDARMLRRAIKTFDRGVDGEDDGDGDDARWGDMTIVRPSLPIPMKGAIVRRSRPSDIGAVPKRFDRLPIDGNVFDRKRKQPGGTVAIDCSGSMQLSSGDVDAILRAIPGATVATYNGEGTRGELRIVAERGRIAKPEDMRSDMSGNIIDGPVLGWLAKQSQPRIWLCDGIVTGVGDQDYPSLYREAMRLARKGQVTRVDDLAGALSALRKRG